METQQLKYYVFWGGERYYDFYTEEEAKDFARFWNVDYYEDLP